MAVMLFLLNYYVNKSNDNVLLFLEKPQKKNISEEHSKNATVEKTKVLHLRIKDEIYDYQKVKRDETRNQTKCLYYKPIVDQEFFYAEKIFRKTNTTEDLETILLQNNIHLYKYYSLRDKSTLKKDFDWIDLNELIIESNVKDVANTLSKMYIHFNIKDPENGYNAPLPRITHDIYNAYSPAPKELVDSYLKTQPILSINVKFEESFCDDPQQEKNDSLVENFISCFEDEGEDKDEGGESKSKNTEIQMYEDFLKFFEVKNPDVVYIRRPEDLLYMKDRLYQLRKSDLVSRFSHLFNRRPKDIKLEYQPSNSDEKRNLLSMTNNLGPRDKSFVNLYFKEDNENGIELEQWNSQLFGRILLEFKTLGNSLILKESDDEFSLQYSLDNFLKIMEKNRNVLSVLMTLCGMLSLTIYNYLNKSKIAYKTVYSINKDNKDHQVLFRDRFLNEESTTTTTLSKKNKTSTLEIKNKFKLWDVTTSLDNTDYSQNVRLLSEYFDKNTLGCPPLSVNNETYHSNVAQVDFKSFFPSLLIYYNLSVENIISKSNSNEKNHLDDTLVIDNEEEFSQINRYRHIVQVEREDKTSDHFPIYITPKRLGIIPKTMITLLKWREEANLTKDNIKNLTFKLLSNCIAGVLSKNKFHLGSPLIHCLMIQKSKVFFNGLIGYLKKRDYVPIHGQCDGMFVPLKINYEEDVETGTLKGIPDIEDLETTINEYLSLEFDSIDEMTPCTSSQLSNSIGNEDFRLTISSTYYKNFYIINLKSYLALKETNEDLNKDVISKDIIRKDLTIKGSGYVQYHVLSNLFLYLSNPTSNIRKKGDLDFEVYFSLFEKGLYDWYPHELYCLERKDHHHILPTHKTYENKLEKETNKRSRKREPSLLLSDKTLILKFVGMVNAFITLSNEERDYLTKYLTEIYQDFTREYHEMHEKIKLPLQKPSRSRLFSEMEDINETEEE